MANELTGDSSQTWWETDIFDVCCLLTLILLLTVVPQVWYIVVLIRVLAIAGLTIPKIRKLPEFWIAITGLLASAIWLNWYWLDNHLYLECYWCFALLLCTTIPARQRHEALATNGRNLLVLSMGFAVLWKAISPDYLSGEFFEFRLLTDARFEFLTAILTDLDATTLAWNREQLLSQESAGMVAPVVLQGQDMVAGLSRWMTWWTIGIELIIAVMYALPRWRGVELSREVILMCFLCTTYFAAPVVGFGWLLCIFGFAQCRSPVRRRIFFLTFLLIQIYAMPIGQVARDSGLLN
ncbi:MAG: hypothetical protein R3C18_17810 [Planctomycetaceae bacterium]